MSALTLTASASAKTFLVSPTIADTTTPSECSSTCSLRQAVNAASDLEELEFAPLENTIELAPGKYVLTHGPIVIRHPFLGLEEHTTELVGMGERASDTIITAEGKSRVVIDGWEGGTSGQVEIKRVQITGGDGDEGSSELEAGEGGGIGVEQNAHLTLNEDTVSGNTAASEGGGIASSGELVVENSTIADNAVTGGLELGGGIASRDRSEGRNNTITVTNSTIADNTIGPGSSGLGGGLFNGTAAVITNSTIAGNTTASGIGGGIAAIDESGSSDGTTELATAIIAKNTGDCSGTAVTDNGGNVADDTSCALAKASSHQSTNPHLAEAAGKPELADNGGATETIYLGSTSPAINAGVAGHCEARDQRGAARPGPGATHCDAGAVEYFARYGVTAAKELREGASATITVSSSIGAGTCEAATCTVDSGGGAEIDVTPGTGYELVGWSGGSCKGTEDPCTIEAVSASETDTAIIAKAAPRYTVTGGLLSLHGGSVTASSPSSDAVCSSDSCSVKPGSTVELSVHPAAGYVFTGWSEETGGSCVGTENPCVIHGVTKSETDEAEVVQPRYAVTGELGASQNELGYIKMSSSSPNPSCAYDEEHPKNFEGFEEGTIILSDSCTVDAGSSVTLEFVNYGNYHFFVAGWSGGSCKGTENPCVVNNVQAGETDVATISDTLPETNLTVKGAIAAGTGTITATSSTTGASCNSSTCKVPPGGSVELAVTPVAGGTFTGWSGGSCKGTENPCVISNVQAGETDTATVRAPITASLGEITGPSVVHVSQYSEAAGLQNFYDAQNGSTIELHAVINDDDVASSYEITYTAQFGGCNGSYADSGTLGPFTLPASNGDQDVAVPLSLTGAHSYPGDAKVSYTFVATRNDGYSAKSASSYFEVGPEGISASNYNPYAVETGSVLNKTATTATMTAELYFIDQSGLYEQNLKEPATAVTPAVEGNGAGFAADELYEGIKPPADAVWLGYSTHAQGGGLAFLGGANESFPTPEYGIFQLGASKASTSSDYVIGPDDTIQQCFLQPGISTEEAPQTVRDVATGLQPDTVYHYRLAQTFAEGICPFKHNEGLEDCLDTHSGTPKYVPYVGGFPAAEGFGGSESGYAEAWNPIFGPEEEFTTAATEEPTPPVVDTTTGEGTTTISCPAVKGFCVGSFSLFEEILPGGKKASIAKTAAPKLVLLATSHFKIPAHSKQKLHFRLSSSGRKYLRRHRHGPFVDKVTARIGSRRLSTAQYVVKLRA